MTTQSPAARHIATELARSATSIGANAEEAQEKEARETIYWLRLAKATVLSRKDDLNWEITEAGELRAMIVAAVKTAQSNSARG